MGSFVQNPNEYPWGGEVVWSDFLGSNPNNQTVFIAPYDFVIDEFFCTLVTAAGSASWLTLARYADGVAGPVTGTPTGGILGGTQCAGRINLQSGQGITANNRQIADGRTGTTATSDLTPDARRVRKGERLAFSFQTTSTGTTGTNAGGTVEIVAGFTGRRWRDS